MVRRLLRALTLGTLMTGVLVPVVAAAPPEHFTEDFEGDFFSPAGDLCDFDYLQVFSGTDHVTIFGDRVQVRETLTVSHTNVSSDYTLTENDRVEPRHSVRIRTSKSVSSGIYATPTERWSSCKPGWPSLTKTVSSGLPPISTRTSPR